MSANSQGAVSAICSPELIKPRLDSDNRECVVVIPDAAFCWEDQSEQSMGDSWMATKRRIISALKPNKTFWHLYSLQTLNPEKLIRVVDKVLRQDFGLIK